MASSQPTSGGSGLFSKIGWTRFDGTQGKFVYWETSFLAQCQMRGYLEIVDGSVVVPKLADAGTDVTKLATIKKNNEGYAYLLLSIDHDTAKGQVAFNVVRNARNADYPNGNLRAAWLGLGKKYRGLSAGQIVKATREYMQLTLDDDSPPDEFMMEKQRLHDVVNQTITESALNNPNGIASKLTKFSEADLMLHAIAALPKKYNSIVPLIEKAMEEGTMDLDELVDKLMSTHSREEEQELNERDSPETALAALTNDLESLDEAALAAVYKKVFKGNCRKCGKRGHKSADCRSGKSDKGRKFSGKCHKCGRTGHVIRNCPDWKNEKSNNAADEEKDEDEDSSDEESEFGLLIIDNDEDDDGSAAVDREDEAEDDNASVIADVEGELFDIEVVELTAEVEEVITRAGDDEYNSGEAVEVESTTRVGDEKGISGAVNESAIDGAVDQNALGGVAEVKEEYAGVGTEKDDDVGADIEEDEEEIPDLIKLEELESNRVEGPVVRRKLLTPNGYGLMGYEIHQFKDDVLVLADADYAYVGTAPNSELIFLEDFTEARKLMESRGLPELTTVARDSGWTWDLHEDVLELMRFYLAHVLTAPSHPLQDTQFAEEHRRYLLSVRRPPPTLEVEHPIHEWLWKFLANISMNSPWLPENTSLRDCLFTGIFRYWAEKLDHWNELKDCIYNISHPEWYELMERQMKEYRRMITHTSIDSDDETDDDDSIPPLGDRDDESVSSNDSVDDTDHHGEWEDSDDDDATEQAHVAVDDLMTTDVNDEEGNELAMQCMIDGKSYPSFDEHTAAGDTGSTIHLWDTGEYLYNKETLNGISAEGIGKAKLVLKGDMPVIFQHTDGSNVPGTLYDVKVGEGVKIRLVSITAAMTRGATIGNDDNKNITLTIGQKVIRFDRRLTTKSGHIQGVRVVPDIKRLKILREAERRERALHTADSNASRINVDIQHLHRSLGHPSIASTRATANANGWNITGTMGTCQDCAMGKAKQAKVSKTAVDYSSWQPGEMMSLDISSPGPSKFLTRHFCFMQCVKTNYTFNFLLKAKSHMAEVVVKKIKELKKKYGITVKVIRCDGAGENMSLQKMCDDHDLGIEFETTAPNSPQHNKVERKIASSMERLRAMCQDAGLLKEDFRLIWPFALALLVQIDNAMITAGNTQSPARKFFGDKITLSNILSNGPPKHVFGEVCVCADRTKHMSKFQPRGKLCLWLGPVKNSSAHNHHLFNLETKRAFKSRNVIFLGTTYAEWQAERAVKEAQRQQLLQ